MPQVAAWLFDAATGDAVDLSDTCVVLPGARAGRLLLWHLAHLGTERRMRVVPPVVVTPGAMVEVMAHEGAPPGPSATAVAGAEPLQVASELARLAAMRQAIEEAPAQVREALLPATGAGTAPFASLNASFAAARTFLALADELGGEGRTLEDAAQAARHLSPQRLSQREEPRWRALADIHARARRNLRGSGLIDPLERHWQIAKSPPGRHPSLRRLVLALVAELNALQRTAIDRFAAGGGAVSVLAHADQRVATALDELGCVQGRPTELARPLVPDGAMVVVEGAADAPQIAIESVLASHGGAVLGLVDPTLGALLEQAGGFAGVDVRLATGRPLASTEAWCTVDAVARWMEGERDASDIARLPAAGTWLRAAVGPALPAGRDLVEALDDSAQVARQPGGSRAERAIAVSAAAHRAIDALLAPLAPRAPGVGTAQPHSAQPPSAQPLPAWADPLRRVLAQLLASLESDPTTRDAVERIVCELAEWSDLPETLAPSLAGAEAARLLASRLRSLRLPAPVRRGGIDALGWLELHADDSPHLVLLGLHEGCVPRSVTADAFLPDALRSALGMPDDAHAAARDAYLLAAMQRGRTAVTAVACRRGTEGDPLLASRLLLEVPAPALPDRLQRLAGRGARRFPAPRGLAAPASGSAFVVPPAPQVPVVLERIRVTEFRSFLECPYRYWLEHRLRLEGFEPATDQLDPAAFGTLAHAVLQRWGRDPEARERRHAPEIRAALELAMEAELDQLSAACFRGEPPLPVLVQVERLRERLDWFAAMQAAHRAAGWHVLHVEWPLPEDAHLDIPDGPPVQVVGRIDRIDRHDDGRHLLIDYKTADSPLPPEKRHARKTPEGLQWLDLQLPLYGWLGSPALGLGAWDCDLRRLEVAYCNISRTQESTEILAAKWTSAQIEEAIETARWVVAMIREGRFARTTDDRSRTRGRDPFARICHTRALDLPDDDDEEEGT